MSGLNKRGSERSGNMRFWFRNWTVSGSRVPLKPGADCHFAAGLEDAGGGTETLGAKFRIAHASAIVKDVQRTFGRCTAPLFAFAGRAEDQWSGSV